MKPVTELRIAITNDHAGFELKKYLTTCKINRRSNYRISAVNRPKAATTLITPIRWLQLSKKDYLITEFQFAERETASAW